jgi:geranylgeranyl pyrophosphate synthase
MFISFQDYWGARKPKLDDAFQKQLRPLLEPIPLKETAALLGTLEGGKKIRGCLACLISDALGGVLEESIPRAIAVELIQAATLIHDDFVDQDTIRRNKPAAWTLEGARRAVLIGDVLFATAIKMMNDLGRDDGRVVSQAIAQVARGALHEPLSPPILAWEIESNRIDGKLYEKIIRLKTGILFGTACELGALAARADGRLGKISFRYGIRIGEAYQIADDLKEVEQYLAGRHLHSGQLAALAPALLYFVADLRPFFLSHLREKGEDLSAATAEFFRVGAKLMKNAIERRLKEGVSEITGNFPSNQYTAVLRQAPWDLIRMFNES